MDHRANHKLLTRQDVVEQFGIPLRFLEKAVGRGDGPPIIRIGRSVRYLEQDILDWIEANRFSGQ